MTAASVWFDMSVIWLSICLSSIAAVSLFLAAAHSLPELRATFAAAGVLASIYCGGYLWLAFNIERAAEWSALFRPVGMISWVVAWTMPPVITMRVWRKLRAAADVNVHPLVRPDVGDLERSFQKGA